jgi:FixJ family two-component response regulator/chemotaxis methyl-accepting protein methylase/signal transduction histidine kinase
LTGPAPAGQPGNPVTPVVAIGASSGGLEAVTALLEALDPAPDSAFVLIQHLDSHHESLLVELLAPHTSLRVVEISASTILQAKTLFVMPPGHQLTLDGSFLMVHEPEGTLGTRRPLDGFLASLAGQQGNKAACVILSGNGNDGSAGLGDISAVGGRVFVQEPEEATYPAMPLSAIGTGLVDLVAPVAAIALALVSPRPLPVPPLKAITKLLEAETGRQVSAYKPTTVVRRIARRMALCGIKAGRLDLYLAQITGDKKELSHLAKELLIHVTSFFRDTEVFARLEQSHLPALLEAHDPSRPLRVWVAGCSTGEEAYSLAIIIQEAILAGGHDIRLQMFASDVEASAIKTARAGRYSAKAISNLTPQRQKAYFRIEKDGVQVVETLRNDVVFAVQDILSDPPFGQMDLISCRNLLIYLSLDAQSKVLDIFDFALQADGQLLLGQAESVGGKFFAIDTAIRLFQKVPRASIAIDASRSRPGRTSADNEMDGLRQALVDADEARRFARDEALAVSEEYQSANEELLTSKEELQALNEELAALNSQLQEALSQQRTLSTDLQNVLYSTDIATVFLDTALKIRFFTPATSIIFNVITSDVGRPLSDLRALADDPSLYSDALAVVAGAPPIETEVCTAPAGSKASRWFSRRIMPYLSKALTNEGVVVTYTDITDQREASQALEAARAESQLANLAKSRFLATASHDMRQPLQTLTLLLALLRRGPEVSPSKDSTLKLLDRFGRILSSMGSMLDALLGINQVEAGTIVPEIIALPANHFLAELADAFGDAADANNVRLRYVASSLWVKSDGTLLDQILRNLVANAIKFAPGGTVLLGCRPHGESVCFEVWDNGEGMVADDLASVFGEYIQLPHPGMGSLGETAALQPGLGLGLAIVRRLSGLLGHDVEVRSWPGRGSVFSITVPRVVAAVLPTPVAPPVKRTDQSGNKAHGLVLIVDDDPDVRDTLETLIKAGGYQVMTARDGPAALAACATLGVVPDVMLADYNLPGGMDGLALKTALEEQAGTMINSVILSGDISLQALQRFKTSGLPVMIKPVSEAALFETLARAMAENASATVTERLSKLPPETRRMTICLIEDSLAVRQTLSQMLEADGFTVASFASASAYLEAAVTMEDRLLILDQGLPGMSGLELLAQLAEQDAMWPCILLSGRSDQRLAVLAMQAGAFTVLVKPVSRLALLAEIAAALSASADSIQARETRQAARNVLAGLTERQQEIMERLLLGQPNKIIADDLGISQRTVENHRAAIMARTATKSLPALARLAMLARQRPAAG